MPVLETADQRATTGVRRFSAAALKIRSNFVQSRLQLKTGGEGGIRTLEASLHPPNRLAGGPFRPLKHLSEFAANNIITDSIKKTLL